MWTVRHASCSKAHLLQVGRAPLHVAAETGNLESLIRLLDAGAHRAPRDRVSPSIPLLTHATIYIMAFSLFSCNACWHMSPGCYLYETWWSLAEDISFTASQKAEEHAYATQHAEANSQQGMCAVLAPVAFTCHVATLCRCGKRPSAAIAHFCSVL